MRPTPENARRVAAALGEFGFASTALTAADFEAPHRVVQLGVEPWRVDLLTSLEGLTWDEAAAHAGHVDWGVRIPVIGPEELIRNKRATARSQELLDAEALGDDGR